MAPTFASSGLVQIDWQANMETVLLVLDWMVLLMMICVAVVAPTYAVLLIILVQGMGIAAICADFSFCLLRSVYFLRLFGCN